MLSCLSVVLGGIKPLDLFKAMLHTYQRLFSLYRRRLIGVDRELCVSQFEKQWVLCSCHM